MAMENPFEGKEIWFGVGSQDLYGEEALRQVAQQTGEMVDFLNATGKIPAKIVLKPTLKSSDGVKTFMTEASANPNVIGVITWCHTFSPAKMWIRGLEVLTKPLLQLATQHHKEIPWETIDMDFMNLNQAAHGDREFGYIVSRLGIPRKIVVGHYTDPEVAEKVGTWARACAGWDASQNMKVMRWGDNMRNVAVTEGDKTEAERVFGASINTWAVNDLVAAYEKVKDSQVKDLIEDYKAKYDVAPELLDSRYDELFIAAKEEAAMVNMMRENGCTAGVDNFEDLGTLPQLPGVGPQRFPSEYGWGFSAEGDWKTSVLVRIGAVMGYGLEGGASLMEDYSYNFVPGLMGLIFMLICAMMTSVSIVREKEVGTMEVLLVSPVRPFKIIFAKMIPYFAISCCVLILILLLARYLLGVPMSGGVAGIFSLSLLYLVLSLSLGLLVSTIARTQVAALLISAMVMMMPILMLSGMLFPIENLPKFFQTVSLLVPTRWYIDAVRKMMIQGASVVEVWQDCVILFCMTALVLGVSLKKFNDKLE